MAEINTKQKTASGLRITSFQDGFRRAGRAWTGVTEIAVSDLADDVIKAIQAEPKLKVESIKIPVEGE